MYGSGETLVSIQKKQQQPYKNIQKNGSSMTSSDKKSAAGNDVIEDWAEFIFGNILNT